jgi:hypothetical protein
VKILKKVKVKQAGAKKPIEIVDPEQLKSEQDDFKKSLL